MPADELLRYLVAALEEVGVPYALGGSIASIAYGEPRATLDIDVVASWMRAIWPSSVSGFHLLLTDDGIAALRRSQAVVQTLSKGLEDLIEASS